MGLRLGVFGGAFDPPHNAHVALAGAAVAQFTLDQLLVIPTGHAWHKARALSLAADRLAMAQLAFADLPRTVVDAREVLRSGPTYTIDTLEALQAEHPAAQLHLFMGADQFAAFRQWHRWEAILRLAIICIADRGDSALAAELPRSDPPFSGRVRLLALPSMAVSATRVRQLAALGDAAQAPIAPLVPPAVARYISQHRLYAAGPPT